MDYKNAIEKINALNLKMQEIQNVIDSKQWKMNRLLKSYNQDDDFKDVIVCKWIDDKGKTIIKLKYKDFKPILENEYKNNIDNVK